MVKNELSVGWPGPWEGWSLAHREAHLPQTVAVSIPTRDDVFVRVSLECHRWQHFTRYPGLFLYHYHNLEHEDMGMMRNHGVVARAA